MNKYFTILLFFAFGFLSCNQVIEIDVPYEGDQLVVNSFFHPDSVITVTLSHSKFILKEGNFERIEGATAVLMSEEGATLDEMNYKGNGIYKSSIKPQPGTIYRIKVSKEGYETVTAHDMIPATIPKINKIEVRPIQKDYYTHSFSIWLNDPQGHDFYELYVIQKETTTFTDTTYVYTRRIFLSSTEAIFQEFDVGETGSDVDKRFFIFEDELFNGTVIKLDFKAYFNRCYSDPCNSEYEYKLHINKISESYYRYKKTTARQDDNGDNPFSEPVIVYDNVKNGLGIFAGFNTAVYPIEIAETNE